MSELSLSRANSFAKSRVSTAEGSRQSSPSSRMSSRGKYMSRSTTPALTVESSVAAASEVSAEDRWLAMLGKKDISKIITETGKVLYREESCGACGIIHTRPDLMDMYYNCKSCHCTLREPAALRKRYADVPQACALEVISATYGDPFDPDFVIDVTKQVEARVKQATFADRLAFKPIHHLDELFEVTDPTPGKNKQLRVRYRIGMIHGTLILDLMPNSSIPSPFLLILPRARYLRIYSGTYGYPKGISSTGRMMYDVSEILQSIIDQNGGSYLSISSYTPIARLLGDPCPGYPKDLRICFEIVGRSGCVTNSELRGHLRKKLSIQCSPTVQPLIFVLTATYGITPTARRDRLQFIARELRAIEAIEHKARQGIVAKGEELKQLRKKPKLLEQREMFQNAKINFIEVSLKLQKIVDKSGICVHLSSANFDPNFTFGNPTPGVDKILECYLDCSGHDSERHTETNEMTDTGYTRNFITIKRERFNILVVDDPVTGQGIMQEKIDFQTDNASPVIVITKATYGEVNPLDKRDVSRMIDVTGVVQNLVEGRQLIIDTSVNLNELFYVDPSPGKRKQLRVEYMTRGFTGNLRVREKDDLLATAIELGYPPVAPPDDDDYVVN